MRDSRFLAVASESGTSSWIVRYDLASLLAVDSVPLPPGLKLTDMEWSEDGEWILASAVHNGTWALITILDRQGRIIDTVDAGTRPHVRWEPGGHAVLSIAFGPGTADDLVRIPVSRGHFNVSGRTIILGQIPTAYVGVLDVSLSGRVAVVTTPTLHELLVLDISKPSAGWRSVVQRTGYLDATPALSPDGAYIAGDATDNLGDNIYVFSVDSGAERAVTAVRGTRNVTRWSPSGRQIAFTRAAPDPALVTIDAAGGAERVVLRGSEIISFFWMGSDTLVNIQDTKFYLTDAKGVLRDSMSIPDSLGAIRSAAGGSGANSAKIVFSAARTTAILVADLATKRVSTLRAGDERLVVVGWIDDGSVIMTKSGEATAKQATDRHASLLRMSADGSSLAPIGDIPGGCRANTIDVARSGNRAVCSLLRTRPDVWLADRAGRSRW